MAGQAVRPRRTPRLVSVILPVRNEAHHLPTQLEALSRQSYADAWEVVVVDNASDDATPDIARSWRDRLRLRVVDAPCVGLNRARNVGLRAASGDLLVYCDGDDRVSSGWLDALVAAAADVDLAGGFVDPGGFHEASPSAGSRPCDDAGRASKPADLPVKHGFLPAVPGGNFAIWADVARSLGWDERYAFGSSDIEFSWRARLHGLVLTYASEAVVDVRIPATAAQVARKHYAYGRSDPQLFADFRSAGMSRSSTRAAMRQWLWLLVHVVDLARTVPRRRRWVRVAARRAGRLRGSVEHRVWFP